jgi:hypothetical protein
MVLVSSSVSRRIAIGNHSYSVMVVVTLTDLSTIAKKGVLTF